jgi:hypothetical protein
MSECEATKDETIAYLVGANNTCEKRLMMVLNAIQTSDNVTSIIDKMLANTEQQDPEFNKIINDNFWELI